MSSGRRGIVCIAMSVKVRKQCWASVIAGEGVGGGGVALCETRRAAMWYLWRHRAGTYALWAVL